MTFEQLKLTPPLLRAVAKAGYTQPSPIQAKAIPPVLAGRDLLGCAQTGTGKTAAFALPMLQRLSAAPARQKGAIRALILTPTRELALQIGDSFAAYGKYLKLRHTVIFGGVGQQPQIDALKKGVDILVACPGRLNDLIGQGYISLQQVEIFVLDEADRMLDMGFIHDVKKVMAKLPPKTRRQTLLFSATMPAEIEQLAAELLDQPAFVKVDPVSSTVDRIAQSLYYVEKANKKHLLPHLIQTLTPPVTNALVFSRTKHGADKIARDLTKKGIPAAAIHGNKSQNARVAALEGFKAGKTRVLVATDIAARGIDINELAYVFNYDLPEVAETYVHRIGRTARAGADGCAVSFCCPDEAEYLAGIEKLNRKKIPVVAAHPWSDAAAPQPAAAKAVQMIQEVTGISAGKNSPTGAGKEDTVMEDKEKRTAPQAQGETLSASAKRRRRRRRSKAAAAVGEAAAAQPSAPKADPKPARQEKPAKAPRQPKFDPHFLSAAAASQARGEAKAAPKAEQPKKAQPKPEAKPARQEKPAKAAKQPQQPVKQPAAPKAEKPAKATAQPVKPAAAPKAEPPKKAQPKPEPQIRVVPKAEDPGLLLISRRPPQQKFASFEEYMAAHGGATAPIEDHTND